MGAKNREKSDRQIALALESTFGRRFTEGNVRKLYSIATKKLRDTISNS